MKSQIDKIRQIGGENFCDDYSGRGMFGKTCVGIITDTAITTIGLVGIPGAKIDNMGKQYIVYWPKLSVETP